MRDCFVAQICRYRNQQKCDLTECAFARLPIQINYAKLDWGTFLLIGIISHICGNLEKRGNYFSSPCWHI